MQYIVLYIRREINSQSKFTIMKKFIQSVKTLFFIPEDWWMYYEG